MFATPFMRYLINLRQQLPETSLYYLSREEAHRRLVELSGEDFGYEDKRWERWGVEHRKFISGYEPRVEGEP